MAVEYVSAGFLVGLGVGLAAGVVAGAVFFGLFLVWVSNAMNPRAK